MKDLRRGQVYNVRLTLRGEASVSGLDMRQEKSVILSQVGRGRVISGHLGLRNAFSGDGGQKKRGVGYWPYGVKHRQFEVIQPSQRCPAFS